MIEVDGLVKLYGTFAAVSDLGFRVDAGAILGLVGPNGAGKTTTLRCLVGIIPPTRGTIRIYGRSLSDEPLEAKRHLAFLPDEPRLFEYLTVEEHLQFTARMYGTGASGETARSLLEMLDLWERRRALPAELSRGMRQKLQIACALVHDPKAILFDEPLTGLDPFGIRQTKLLIRELARGGAAIIVSSHLLHLVEEICDQVLVLNRGRKVAGGPIEEIARSIPELRADATLEEVFLRVTRPREEKGGM